MNNRKTILLTVCTVLMTTLSACGTSPPARLYLVEPVVVRGSEAPAVPLTVLVDKVVLPKYLTRKEILSRDQDYVVSAAMFDRWAEPLETNVTSALAENLSALIRSDRVVAYPWALSEPADFGVSVQIIAFGPAPSGDVVLKALWRVVDSSGDTIVLRRSHYSASRQTPDPAATVGAMSLALGDLSREIAATLSATSPSQGESL